MEDIRDGVFRLKKNMEAWNINGSATDRLEGTSWIRFWEETTGRARGRCSFSDCGKQAQVGGHIWIARKGVFIAPICSSCNYSENVRRMQGGNSFLRVGSLVVQGEYTDDMARAARTIAISVCQYCGTDISDRPENHTLCYECYMEQQRQPPRRRCSDCGTDICDRPENHTQCLQCYRNGIRGRQCQDCRTDISDRPENHTQCLQCYRNRQRRRKCQDCRSDISDRPENHTQCLHCYRDGQPRRLCKDCGTDISDQPETHIQCFECYRGAAQWGRRRRCQDCGTDISDRPENHKQCLQCYRGGQRRRATGNRYSPY